MRKKEVINEMAQIQKGLEEFLEREVKGYGVEGAHSQAHNLATAGKGGKNDKGLESENRKSLKKDRKGRKRKKRKKRSFFKKFLIFLLLLGIAVGGLWYYAVGALYSKMQYAELDSVAMEPMKEDGVINILLLGNDSRKQGTDGRSDTMILLSISNETKTIHITSLLRDMYVEIPGYKNNRLNAAYSYGGPQLLMEVLERNFDIDVNRYASVNFQAFADVVDAVGGVDLELSNEEVRYVNGYLVEYNILEGNPEGTHYLDPSLSGMVHLNGPQALSYCRNRLIGNDFGRTQRQRKVLMAIIEKMPAALTSDPSELIDGILPNLTTNLTKKECMELSLQAARFLTYDIVQESIPIKGSYSGASIRGMSVLEVDFEKNKEYIRKYIYGEGDESENGLE